MTEIHDIRLSSMLPLEVPERIARTGGVFVLTALVTIHSIETEKVDVTEHGGPSQFLDGPTTVNAIATAWAAL